MLKHTICAVGLMLAIASLYGFGQDIQRLDPSANQLIPSDAKLERVAGGFNKWTEGPVWTHEGSLLFAEIPSNRIRRWKPGTKDAEVFMESSGYSGTAPYGGPEPG